MLSLYTYISKRKGVKIVTTAIKTKYGEILGIEEDDYVIYKGIPYAKPPVAELRWKAPEEPDKWNGVYEATEFSAKCPQNENPYGFFGKEFYGNPEFLRKMDEDCLYLNIWTPKKRQEKLPVAFYIHGGGFGGGYSSEIEFDGEEYCKRDVILVTINYRVNLFGFLAHPWLCEENERGISGNYGILDQIAALTWVYENIANFGGDPDNITVFGQSAGCMSTQVLISTELTGNMISKAILQSGVKYKGEGLYAPTLKEEMVRGTEWAALTGAKNLAELRALTIEQIAKARDRYNEITWQRGDGIVIVPNADGYVLKEPVNELFEKGEVKDIPFMVGSVTKDLWVTEEELKNGIRGELAEDCGLWSLYLEKLGRTPAYVYYFSHELPGDEEGAFHSAELWYTFGTLKRCWRPMKNEDYELSRVMMDYWTNFMKNGKPSENGEWRAFTEKDKFIMEFK